MTCLYCKTEFNPKNKKGIYCSNKCRVYGNRNKNRNSKDRIVTHIVTNEWKDAVGSTNYEVIPTKDWS